MNQWLRELRDRVLTIFPLTEERNSFFENVSMLVLSGTPLTEALHVVVNEARSRRMKIAIADIVLQVENGEHFWKALDRHRYVFSEYEIRLTKIAEESGQLAKSLGYLSVQLAKDLELRGKIRSALFYPLFVLTFAVIIGLGITWFVLPRLSRVFSSLHIVLPFMTRVLIRTGAIINLYGAYIFPGVLALLLAAFFILRLTRARYYAAYALEILPGIGQFLRDVQTAKTALFTGTLLESGVPMLESLETLIAVSEGPRSRKFFTQLRDRVSVGDSFERSFADIREARRLFPPLTQYMIFTGEKSGNLPGAFLYIANTYGKKLDAAAKNLSQILEPVLLVVIAMVVAFIAIAIITPIYGLVSNFGAPTSAPRVAPAEVSIPEEIK
ncbi:MAG: type II secretion system F family protein [Candidatus Harrisonbacteria bacterium]|nr:type II secretion system F family protein [Candidatus Harrisonbacteria bacterium]